MVVVEIPGWKMILDWAHNVCEAMAKNQNDPSIARPEIVNGLADFIRVTARIQAKAMIRKGITGSEYPEEPPVETKKSKRQNK